MNANAAASHHIEGFRWRLGDPSLTDAEARLYDLGILRSVLNEVVEMAVADARADGATWVKIADALGVTHQAAIKRYGKGGGRR
ncbi:hypothetical protein GCM10009688_11440 [Arthrobacter gandavensis]|uniref:Helix-turn-helix domain-containing protein n=1 Tax=Arthrobacter gandavensis TaxID=169960 RepID=A0ABP5AGT4_9MICC|nr:hypothetical protein [Arthrobacter citreus]